MLPNLRIGDIEIKLYVFFNAIAFFVLLIYILSKKTQYKEILLENNNAKTIKFIIPVVELLAISIIWFLLFLALNKLFAIWFTEGNANYYGTLVAWMIVLLSLPQLFKVSSFKIMDLLSPGLPLCLFISKIACIFQGCCHGFEMENSFYFNQLTNRYEFPVQMLESLVALGLFIFISCYQKKNEVSGSVFPIYLILYSLSRFITEFFRGDLSKVLGPFDAYQILSVVFLLIGGIFLNIVCILYLKRDQTAKKKKKYKNKC